MGFLSFLSLKNLPMIAGITAVLVVLGLTSWTAAHFHNAYVEAREEISALETTAKFTNQAIASCEDSVKEHVKQSEERSKKAEDSVSKARVLAKKNEELAQKLLDRSRDIPKNSCPEGNAFINEYLNNIRSQNVQPTSP